MNAAQSSGFMSETSGKNSEKRKRERTQYNTATLSQPSSVQHYYNQPAQLSTTLLHSTSPSQTWLSTTLLHSASPQQCYTQAKHGSVQHLHSTSHNTATLNQPRPNMTQYNTYTQPAQAKHGSVQHCYTQPTHNTATLSQLTAMLHSGQTWLSTTPTLNQSRPNMAQYNTYTQPAHNTATLSQPTTLLHSASPPDVANGTRTKL